MDPDESYGEKSHKVEKHFDYANCIDMLTLLQFVDPAKLKISQKKDVRGEGVSIMEGVVDLWKMNR